MFPLSRGQSAPTRRSAEAYNDEREKPTRKREGEGEREKEKETEFAKVAMYNSSD